MSSTPDAKETRIEQGDISTIITDCRNRDNSSDDRDPTLDFFGKKKANGRKVYN